ncbi:MAG TPA: hypothetical protein VNU01_05690, partial [Egibacteraceae bacterium]|nr:hypothetical protein [Egibacteraceae bacterium]
SLMGPEFTISFGADSGPEAGVAGLRQMQERGEDPFALILKLLDMPFTSQEREGGPSPIFTWPSVFGKPAAEWTEQDEAQLRELGDERDIQAWREFGEYGGWRLGIDAAGTWLYLVAGD